MLSNKWVCFCAASLLGASLQACGADEGVGTAPHPEDELEVVIDTQAAAELNLVDRLVIDRELVVEFYEPAPGVLLTSEYGIAGHASIAKRLPNVELADLRPSDYYALFAPDREIPPALLDSESRLDPRPDTASIVAGHVRPVQFGASDDASGANANLVDKSHGGRCDSGWFNDSFCNSSGWDFQWCLLNQRVNRSPYCTDLAWFEGAICTDLGTVTWDVSAGDGQGGTWSVQQGHYRTFGKTCGSSFIDFCDEFKVTASIKNVASSDRYHDRGFCTFD